MCSWCKFSFLLGLLCSLKKRIPLREGLGENNNNLSLGLILSFLVTILGILARNPPGTWWSESRKLPVLCLKLSRLIMLEILSTNLRTLDEMGVDESPALCCVSCRWVSLVAGSARRRRQGVWPTPKWWRWFGWMCSSLAQGACGGSEPAYSLSSFCVRLQVIVMRCIVAIGFCFDLDSGVGQTNRGRDLRKPQSWMLVVEPTKVILSSKSGDSGDKLSVEGFGWSFWLSSCLG